MIPSAVNKLRVTTPRVAGLLCAGLGLFVLSGWMLEVAWIKSMLPGAVTMKANTAVGFLLAGVALFLLDSEPSERRRIVGRVLALLVAALGLATLGQFAFGGSLGIDELLFRDSSEVLNRQPGRMSPYTAIAFSLLGPGIAAIPSRRLRWLVVLAGGAALLIGSVSFVGYLWNARELVTDEFAAPVAVHTGIGFILLGTGVTVSLRRADDPLHGSHPDLTSVERKTLGGFVATVILLLAAGGLSYRASVRESESAALVSHTFAVEASLGRIYAAVSDAESQQRNFLLTGDGRFLEEFGERARDATAELGELSLLVADNERQMLRLDPLEAAVRSRIEVLRDTTRIHGQSGLAAAQERIRDGEGRALMESVRREINRMGAMEAELLVAREAEVARDRVVTLLSLLATLTVALVGFLVLFRAIQREMRIRAVVEEELDRFFSLSLDFLCIAGADGHFKRVSPAVTDMLGWSVEEFLRTPYMDLVHPEDRASTAVEVERQMKAGEKVMHFENRYRHKDGSWRVLSWRSVPHGGLMYATARDVTEERMRQKEIEGLNAGLQSQAAQLEMANRELEAFSHSVSHDLRAPLRHVQGYVEMLARDSKDTLSERSRRFLQTISEAAQEMGRLIDDLLSFSRMARAEMHEGVVDLNALIEEVRGELGTMAAGRDIRWTVPALPAVRGDRAMLKQVVANLLDNAVKYTRNRSTAEIEIGCARDGNGRIEFCVRDNGAGFDMKYADKLFGVFQRLHRADEFEGTGIGLANVRRIIARHGGETRAEGAVEEGAAIYFTLGPAGGDAGRDIVS